MMITLQYKLKPRKYAISGYMLIGDGGALAQDMTQDYNQLQWQKLPGLNDPAGVAYHYIIGIVSQSTPEMKKYDNVK